MKGKGTILIVLFISFGQNVFGQCAMCKAVAADKALEIGESSVNTAIIYIMAMPYLILGGVAFFAFRKKIIPFFKDMRNAKG